jgi:hypothetical protein
MKSLTVEHRALISLGVVVQRRPPSSYVVGCPVVRVFDDPGGTVRVVVPVGWSARPGWFTTDGCASSVALMACRSKPSFHQSIQPPNLDASSEAIRPVSEDLYRVVAWSYSDSSQTTDPPFRIVESEHRQTGGTPHQSQVSLPAGYALPRSPEIAPGA